MAITTNEDARVTDSLQAHDQQVIARVRQRAETASADYLNAARIALDPVDEEFIPSALRTILDLQGSLGLLGSILESLKPFLDDWRSLHESIMPGAVTPATEYIDSIRAGISGEEEINDW